MTKYEVMFIVDPSLDDDRKETIVEFVKDIINADGEAGEANVWGTRKLAYPINKKSEGHYVVVDFEGNPTLPKELDRRLRNNEDIMRHIIVAKEEK